MSVSANVATVLSGSVAEAKNVGILAMEIYFPNQFVDQTDLEEFDGASKDKYTIGLGQLKMGFCDDREDIHSICLTVVQKMMEKHNIEYERIGRLEVGTETIVDKSKSVKTVLMQLFEPSGNTDVEGVDTTNACYGGTSALLNAIAWIQSPFWDGRLALVVCGDIAVYPVGPARPTGGAGAVAMLIGPDAPIVIDKVRASHMTHAYDFYKPDLSCEYPTVDGRLSIECYLSALDRCYQLLCRKDANCTDDGEGLDRFDYFCFHTPYCKLVQKSFARLCLNDFVVHLEEEEAARRYPQLLPFRGMQLADTYSDRQVEQAAVACSKEQFAVKTQPSLMLASLVGNMYTPSLYAGLVSLLVNQSVESLLGKRIGMFSYGSGLASTMFSLRVTATDDSLSLKAIKTALADVPARLESRRSVPAAQFTAILAAKEEAYNRAPYSPVGPVQGLAPGVYYLSSVDAKYRRHYARIPPLDGTSSTTAVSQ